LPCGPVAPKSTPRARAASTIHSAACRRGRGETAPPPPPPLPTVAPIHVPTVHAPRKKLPHRQTRQKNVFSFSRGRRGGGAGRVAASGAGARVRRSRTISTPSQSPTPRTSPTCARSPDRAQWLHRPAQWLQRHQWLQRPSAPGAATRFSPSRRQRWARLGTLECRARTSSSRRFKYGPTSCRVTRGHPSRDATGFMCLVAPAP